jgi:general secretion pathway protein D
MSYIKCRSAGLLAVFTLLILPWAALAQEKPVAAAGIPPAKSVGTPADQRFVSIDFNDVDINVFIKFISELTGKNFVVDQRVRGKVTIISPGKISLEETYKVFESVLEVHGFTTVQAGDIIKIIPSPDARAKNIETRLKEEATSAEDRVVTQLMPLQYAEPEEIKKLFAPMVSRNSVILAYAPTSMLIVTDVLSNIQRLIKILKVIDVPGIGQEISVIPLKFSDAGKLVTVLGSIFQNKQRPRKVEPQEPVKFVADERTNSVVLMASEDDTAKIKGLIKLLDKEVPRGTEKIRVYYLENATAQDLAKVLQEIPNKQGAAAQAKGKVQAPILSDKVRITPDKATNSLIIMADKDDYQVIEDIIKKLDIPRAMVYIEALIMEVNVNKSFTVGTEWRAAGTTTLGGKINSAFGGGFTSTGDNLSGIGTSGSLPQGFSVGIVSQPLTIGTVTFPNVAAVAQAYRQDQDVHILSTPQVLTTDNEEASITVGKNVPYQVRSSVDAGLQVYNSFEYKDVGITLKITPQISKGRMVRLKINQEVTKLDQAASSASATSNDRPTTLKRTINTTVIVKDGNTVVIGGLIDDSITNTQYKVPCLGDVPGAGWLFKSMGKGNEKTNLFVFLTPRVVKNPTEMQGLYESKKAVMDTVRENNPAEPGHIKLYRNSNAVPQRLYETPPSGPSLPTPPDSKTP